MEACKVLEFPTPERYWCVAIVWCGGSLWDGGVQDQCKRRATHGDFCWQHARIDESGSRDVQRVDR